jgi:hypothetical protein
MKIKSMLVAFLAGSVLVGCATDGSKPQNEKSGLTQAAGDPKVQPAVGWTKDQVIQTFGKTDNISVGSDGESWTYHLNMGEAFIPFNFGYKPKFRIITFGKDGLVSSWSFSQ